MWRIDTFTITEEQARLERLRSTLSFSSRGRGVPAGTYRRLSRDGRVIMSDTPDELRDLAEFRRRCRGSILINGLGLGRAVGMALDKPDVTDVTVIEIEREVIELLAPQFSDPRLTIHLADATTWGPKAPRRWNVVWHDIWDYICADNLPEMRRLHRRYARRCDWQGSWCRAECERAAG